MTASTRRLSADLQTELHEPRAVCVDIRPDMQEEAQNFSRVVGSIFQIAVRPLTSRRTSLFPVGKWFRSLRFFNLPWLTIHWVEHNVQHVPQQEVS